MTLLVPFDGTALARAALVRASEFGAFFDREVLAVTVIPQGNDDYAREHGWIGEDEPFELETVVTRLREQVAELCPEGEFQYEVVDRYAPAGTISNRVRRLAREVDATMVFVGSENAGHMVTTLSSVGGGIAADEGYDVTIVRHPDGQGITAEADDEDSTPA